MIANVGTGDAEAAPCEVRQASEVFQADELNFQENSLSGVFARYVFIQSTCDD